MSPITLSATASRLSTLLAGALTLVGALTGCSGSGEDVRVTLCKDLVAVQLGSSPGRNWTEASTETRGYQYARVKLRWSAADGDGSASCFYDYNAVEDTAMALSDPLSSYAASPSKMVLNGNTLSRPALAEAVKQAMLKQGKALVDKVKSGI
ncbi:MAG: hypothetical protein WBM40_05495 [Thiohalocapsa sp.]